MYFNGSTVIFSGYEQLIQIFRELRNNAPPSTLEGFFTILPKISYKLMIFNRMRRFLLFLNIVKIPPKISL